MRPSEVLNLYPYMALIHYPQIWGAGQPQIWRL